MSPARSLEQNLGESGWIDGEQLFMYLSVFGGSGATGRLTVEKLIDRGHSVTVLSRNSASLPKLPNLVPVQGNVLSLDDVRRAVPSASVVLIELGFNNSDPDTMSRGTRSIIQVMREAGCRRLICLSAHGAGDSWEYMPQEFKRMVEDDAILRTSFRDHDLQERYVRESGLDWTIVRPSEIVDEAQAGRFTVDVPPPGARFQIPRADVAQFIVDEAEQSRFLNRVVLITE